jgi:Ca-activated chloride channel family protein
MTFLAGARLWLLVLVPLFAAGYFVMQRRRRRYAMRFASVAMLDKVAPRQPGWRRHVAALLALAMVGLLVVAFAKPAKRVRVAQERATIVIVIDTSGSMAAQDVKPTRLDAAKTAASEFAQSLPERFNVALVAFDDVPRLVVPPTTDHDQVVTGVQGLELGGATATGDALISALDAIKLAPADPAHPNDPAPARIVLLSDGARTAGRSVTSAIEVVHEAGVPVSTISFGTPYGTVSEGGVSAPVPADEDTMRQIASGTGGKFYTAQSLGQLQEVYRDIGTSVGYTFQKKEITSRFVGIALLAAICAMGFSLAFFGRLP